MSFNRFFRGLAVAVLGVSGLRAGAPATAGFPLDLETPASISITPVSERWDGRGFMALRVKIENRGSRRMGWGMEFTTGIGYGGHSLSRETSLAADRGEALESVVYVPGTGALSSGQRTTVTVRVDGPGSGGHQIYMLSGNSESVWSTATTPALEGALFSATFGAPGTKTEITAVDAAAWPADWRVWSVFQRVVLLEGDYAALDGARRAALRDWVAMGGVLDLYPETEGAATRTEAHGHGFIRRRGRTLAQEAGDSPRPQVELPVSSFDDLRRSRGVDLSAERRVSLQPERGTLGIALFLACFGIVVGPINLFVFAPSGRRQRLFFTVPAISLGASVLLAGYIVVKDGFGGEGARQGTILLLPEDNQAVVTQTQISRTGVLVGTGFELADDVVLEQAGAGNGDWNEYSHRSSGRPTEHYKRTQGRAGGDWFASRRVQEQVLRALTPTRARVELVGGGEAGAAPVVQSSVGATLRDFRYVDVAGYIWGADEVAPGQRVTLTRRKNIVSPNSSEAGRFTARGGAAEGLAPISTLDSIRWDEPEFLYVGPLVGARKP